MPYRVLPNGVIEADTLEEALALREATTEQKPAPRPAPAKQPSAPVAVENVSSPPVQSSPPDAEDRAWQKFSALFAGPKHGDQIKLMTILYGRPKGFGQAELVQGTQAETVSSLGGVVGAIRRKANLSGLEADLVVVIMPGDPAKKREKRYVPGRLLLQYGVPKP